MWARILPTPGKCLLGTRKFYCGDAKATVPVPVYGSPARNCAGPWVWPGALDQPFQAAGEVPGAGPAALLPSQPLVRAEL